jgi:alanine racemase
MTHAPERALARIDLGAVERNCAHLRSLLRGGAELCAVVKADAYGHGDVWCAKAALAGGATWLAVATAAEAETLRRHGIASRILVMGALTHEDAKLAIESMADITVWDEGFARELPNLRPAGAARVRVHVKLDSGMGRLGTKDRDLARALAEHAAADDRLELVGVMTHFATADMTDDDGHFAAQLAEFTPFAEELKRAHPAVVLHAANCAATYRDPAAHFDMVRCGIGVYGLDPLGEDPVVRGLEPALTLESYVAAVKRFEPGDSAGYGRTWKAERPTWVGTVPIGYGDGWRRSLSNNCDVLVRGRRYPLVGTVSMDNITIDLGPDTSVQPGEPVVLIGAQGSERIGAEEVAKRLGTINYEVTCGLSPRVRRQWLNAR